MNYQIFSENEWVYPDSAITQQGKAELFCARGVDVCFQVLTDKVLHGGEELKADWDDLGCEAVVYQMLPACVNENSDAKLGTTLDYDSVKDIVTRQAPFYVYDITYLPEDGKLRAGRAAFYIRLNVGVDAPVGTHCGHLTLKIDGETLNLPVSLKIYKTQVPELSQQQLRMVNWIYYDKVANNHNVTLQSEEYFEILERYLDNELDMRNDVLMIPSGVPVRDEQGIVVDFDFTHAEQVGNLALKKGFRAIMGGFIARWKVWDEDEIYLLWDREVGVTSIEGYRQQKLYFQRAQECVERNNWGPNYMQCMVDEPQIPNSLAYRAMGAICRKMMPGVVINDPTESPYLAGSLDIWVVKQAFYEKYLEEHQQLQALGEEMWVYTCGWPAGKTMNRVMDLPLMLNNKQETLLADLFIYIYPKLKYIPTWIWIPTLILTIFLSAVSRANYRLKKNHQRLKEFVKDDLTQTCFINGCPGTGKTLLNMSMSLACEEVFIEELEEKLLDYEMKHKYLNFAKVRQNPTQFPEHEEYIKNYHLLNDRKSFIISNYAIYSPLFESYSKIFNFDYMRVNKPANVYPLEEYIVISISEFDKEYNSHDDKKIVGEDGAATFFSTVSHDLKRHAKIFVDYQLRQQVPLRIRGNAEYFITIKERKKKYPLLLMVYYLPFLGLYKLTKSLIKKYESRRRTVAKKSFRKGKSRYKRNDITLIYAILRSIGNHLSKICNWFDQFWYFKLKTRISQEDENDTATKGTKKALCINIRDLSYKNQRLYDSTFLSYSYEEKKNEEFMNLDTFTQLSPSKEELDKCNSRFYNKINH